IFQFFLVPEAANFTTSSRMLKFTLSIAFIRLRLLLCAGGSNKLYCTESSGTIPLSITPAFRYRDPFLYNCSTSGTACAINAFVKEVAIGRVVYAPFVFGL